MNAFELSLIVGIVLLLIAWIFVLTDILRNRFPERNMWIIYLIITPPLAVLVYPIVRERLLRNARK
ncbi:MAG: hypothetical protein WBJ36_08560 [Tenuifilum sp.]|uniref:hypothetical protein n=1 Tax=Tenuifilum sp. TaxID=2760880 RepID=UPI001B5DA4EE|nr:hypothetical protein [Bacteroidales bacterium]HOK61935.1 hypothetical protein [Tenuifilum sp.]MBP9029850.1 hypothetical protein [Bacteroidales bacterium]HOK86732.1 hypothetical protein [Tenuifilum sp.]HON69922.1 hypothetical protein [Tenuifilum sp.]